MIRLEMDLIRHALQTASDSGYAEVELSLGEDTFQATFQPRKTSGKSAKGALEGASKEPPSKTIIATSVGYYRPVKAPLQVGQEIAVGDVVGEIAALGLKNELTSAWTGVITQVLVVPEQPVEYGQHIAVMRLSN